MMVSQRMRRWGRSALTMGFAAVSLLVMGSAANAQLIAEDNFSYPAGDLGGSNGGFGWYPFDVDPGAAPWSGGSPNKVIAPGLTYPGLGALGNTASTGGNNSGAYRSLAVNQGSVNGTNTLYISFLARKNPNDSTLVGSGSGTYAGISLFQDYHFGQEQFFMGMPYESATWSFARAGEPGVAPSSVLVDSTVHLFVYRFDFTSAAVDVKLFIDPSTAAEPAIASVQALGLPGFSFQQVRVQSGTQAAAPAIDFDEFKITGDYATAVGVSLTGSVTNYGSNPNPAGTVLTASFRNSTTNAVVATRTATLDAQGNFAFTSIPRGTYKAVFSGRKVLALAVNGLNLSNAVSGQSLVLFGGDANADNVVDVADLLLVINHYNKTLAVTPDDYLEAADFNNDGANDVSDLLTVINNYNKQGAN